MQGQEGDSGDSEQQRLESQGPPCSSGHVVGQGPDVLEEKEVQEEMKGNGGKEARETS